LQYLGGKSKIAKHLLPIILEERKEDKWLIKQWYIEPFVGGCNMIDKVDGRRMGNDNHHYLISLWNALQEGWKPPTKISKKEYVSVRENPKEYADEFVAFVGFLCSFGGKWWGGYASNARGQNYADIGSRMLLKQIKLLEGVKFTCKNYWEMDIPDDSLIYCDPPYQGGEKYKRRKGSFDHDKFWEWCREKSRDGHTVFISEYNAPEDFKEIIAIDHKLLLNKKTNQNRIEKLFRYEVK